MNNKGFSLIEMLAAVVILGILGTIAVVGTTKYIKQSRDKAYIVMSQSIYEAAMNCQTKGDCSVKTYKTDELISSGYLEPLKNPISKNKDCSGSVEIVEKGSSSTEYKKYQYKVSLGCPGIKTTNADITNEELKTKGEVRTLIWPDYKSGSGDVKTTINKKQTLSTMYIFSNKSGNVETKGSFEMCDSDKNATSLIYNKNKELGGYVGSCVLNSKQNIGHITSNVTQTGRCIKIDFTVSIANGSDCSGDIYITIPAGYITTVGGINNEKQKFYITNVVNNKSNTKPYY